MKENNNLLISVIIPCYNPRIKFLKDAVYSVLAQSYKHWELIIVDDGSKEELYLEIDNFISSLEEPQISISRLPCNFGTAVAKNKGVELAKGEIIVFLDYDDIVLPWYLDELVKSFSYNSEASIITHPLLFYLHFFGQRNILLSQQYLFLLDEERFFRSVVKYPEILSEEEKRLYKLLIDKLKIISFLVCVPRLVFKKEVFNSLKFDSGMPTHEDFDLCLQVLNNPELVSKILITSNSDYLYRIYGSNTRLTQSQQLLYDGKVKVQDKYKDIDSLAGKMLSYLNNKNDKWKFSRHLLNYFKHKSIYIYFKDIVSGYSLWEERIQGLKLLLRTVLVSKLSTFLDLDKYKEINFGNSAVNKNHEVKKKLTDYISLCTSEKSKFYTTKALESIYD